MIKWSIGFFILSIIAAFFGFGGTANALSHVAQILFYTFVILFSFFLVGGVLMIGVFKRGGPHDLP